MPRRPQTPPPDAPTEDTDPVAVTIAALSFDEDFEKLNLFQRLARISGHVGNVPKKGYNAFHKYHYVTEADLVGAVRQYLAAAGILMIPDVIETTQLSDELTKVVVEYTVTDGGASFTFKVPGYGSDRGDKGVYKALTGSMKYAIMKLFKIETGDDPEQDTRVDERAAVRGRPPTPRPVEVGSSARTDYQRGGHAPTATATQLRQIGQAIADLGWERDDFVLFLAETMSIEIPLTGIEEADRAAVTNTLKALEPAEAGQLLAALEERAANDEVPEPPIPYG